RQAKAPKTRIAEVAHVSRRHRVAANAKEPQGAPLKAVGGFVAQAANLDQIVAIACRFENLLLLLDGSVGQRIGLIVIRRYELGRGDFGNRVLGDQFTDRFYVGAVCGSPAESRGIANDECVAAECFAREKQAARETERSVKVAIERGLKAYKVDA